MKPPIKGNTWETFIKINEKEEPLQILRTKVKELIDILACSKMLIWYSILIHNGKDFAIGDGKQEEIFYHIRFSFDKKVEYNPDIKKGKPQVTVHYGKGFYDKKGFLAYLPNYCQDTRRMTFNNIDWIVGLDKTFIKDQDIMEAWLFLGKQSELIMDFIEMHHEETPIEMLQQNLAQFLHFFSNMTGFNFHILKEFRVHHLF